MNIDSITIKNFRNIDEETTFRLNTKFTVIIGINGKGKSTILYALRVACGAFFLGIPEVGNRHIIPDKIYLKNAGMLLTPQKPVKVKAEGQFPGIIGPITWQRQILINTNTTTSSEADVGAIRRIAASKYETININGNDAVDLPVIAFLGTSRVHEAGRNAEKNNEQRIGRQIFKQGYQDWDEMKSTKFHYEDWLETYDILVKNGSEYSHTRDAFLQTLKTANPYLL